MRKFWQKKYVSKYTGKEIDDAVAKAGTALQNPMTAAGDIIVGGEDGAAGKLAKGADGKVLKMVSGAPAWADDASGMENPMTTAGDLIVGGTSGAAGRLAKGTDGQVLSMVSGSPAWAAAQGGSLYQHFINITAPLTAGIPMDLIIILYSTVSTAMTIDDIKSLVNTDGVLPITNGVYVQSGGETTYKAATLEAHGTTPDTYVTLYYWYTTGLNRRSQVPTWASLTVSDTVKQIM